MTKLTTTNLILSTPSLDDVKAIYNFKIRNNEHLKQWESIDPEDLNESSIKKFLENWIAESESKKSFRFFLKPKENPHQIIGFCNFTQIFYGAFQACYLGYKIDYEYEGRGLMFEALRAALDYAFETLKLHRIMANYMTGNRKSAILLNRLGFKIEGYAKNYLLINNKWEDHILTSLSKENWPSSIGFKSDSD